MKFIIALALGTLGLLWSQAKAEDQKKDDLVGTYQIVAGERGDQKIAEDRLKDVTVRIAANAITTFDKDKKEVYAATYQLDTSRRPWRITMTAPITPVDGKGTKTEGLIEKDGESVKLIYALPGGKVPTKFKAGEKQQMFVLRKTGR